MKIPSWMVILSGLVAGFTQIIGGGGFHDIAWPLVASTWSALYYFK